MKDGIYQVVTRHFTAGFVITAGRCPRRTCAPILRKNLAYWVKKAVWVGPVKTGM
jgi:hypothetical protein